MTSYVVGWVLVLIRGMKLGMGYKRKKIKMSNTAYFNSMS